MRKIAKIKVMRKTLESLYHIAGELAKKLGKRVTLEDAIVYLLKIELLDVKPSPVLSEVERDRKNFLMILEQKFSKAQPGDFNEYDYNDIVG
jgi:hypothetical protein